MIKENALVTKIDEDDIRFVWIQTQRKSSCGSCSAKSSCGSQVLSKIIGKRSNEIKILNTKNARVGDTISLGIDESSLLVGSVYLYLIPILFMIIMSSIATFIAMKLILNQQLIDTCSIIFAILGFILGQYYTRIKIKSNLDLKQCGSAKMIKIIIPENKIVAHLQV